MSGADEDDPPVDPVRFGVLGTGRMAGKLVAAMGRCDHVEAVAVGSRDKQRAVGFAALYGIPTARGGPEGYEEVVSDPRVEAVYIALPPHRHRAWCEEAARLGKAVLCEKPLAPTAADAAAMADACRAAGVALVDGTQWTRTPRADAFRKVLDGGELGEVGRVTAAFSFPADGWGSTEHRLDPHRGGGVLLDLGWYCVHAALWAFGDDPEKVTATITREPGVGGEPVDVAASGLLTFPGGRTAGFDVSYRLAWRNWVEFAGPGGSLVCDDFTNPNRPVSASGGGTDPARPVRHFRHASDGAASREELPPFDQPAAFLARAAATIRSGGDDAALALALRTQDVLDELREAGT